MSPLQRTLGRLRRKGYTVGITEHWNPHVNIRQDFCGFADCLAFSDSFRGVLAVNAMHLRHRTEHKRFGKNKALKVWLKAGNRFSMHQWHKIGPRGQRKNWKVEVVQAKLKENRIIWVTPNEIRP
jgi:hypothetical protein